MRVCCSGRCALGCGGKATWIAATVEGVRGPQEGGGARVGSRPIGVLCLLAIRAKEEEHTARTLYLTGTAVLRVGVGVHEDHARGTIRQWVGQDRHDTI